MPMEGKKIARLTVISFAYKKNNKAHWNCRCDCGSLVAVNGVHLRNGNTKSCGCWKLEASSRTGKSNTTHGLRHRSEYRIWVLMKSRCYNPKDKGYKNYGGRGIIVSERWKDNFENFLTDMGPRPSKKFSIERQDNDGNYEPGNCHWATDQEQANNRRTNVIVSYKGIDLTIMNAIRVAGNVVSKTTVLHRINRLGWNITRAVETPPRPYGGRYAASPSNQ